MNSLDFLAFQRPQILNCNAFRALVCLICLTASVVHAAPASVGANILGDSSAATQNLKEATSLLDGLGADLRGTAAALPGAIFISKGAAPAGPSTKDHLFNSWSMAGGRADRTSATADRVAVSRMALQWQFDPGSHSAPLWGPVIADGAAFFAAGREIYALDTRSGKLNWKYSLPLEKGESEIPSVGAAPAYAAGRLYIGATNNRLCILDAASGKPLQQVQLDAAVISAPAVTEDALYVATGSGTVYAYSFPAAGSQNMQLLWSRRPAPGEPINIPVAIQGDGIYAATNSGKVFGLQRATGSVFAKTDLGSVAGVQGIAATSSAVLVASGRSLYKLAAADLGAQWARSYPAPIAGPPSYAGGSAFVVTTAGILYATPLGNAGSTGWSVDLGTPSAAQPGVIAAGDIVIASFGGRVYGFAAAGDGAGKHQLLWQYSPPANAEYTATHPWLQPEITAQAIAGGDLYVLARTGELTCLSPNAADKRGPVVDLRYPDGGGYAPKDISGIVARVQDRESGYRRGSLKLVIDGGPIPSGYIYEPDTGRLTYTPPRPFSTGVHTVRVLAADNRNNWSDIHWSFVVDPAALSAADNPAASALRPAGSHPSPDGLEGGGNSLPRGIVSPGRFEFAPNYVRELKPLTRWMHFPLAVYFVRDGEYSPERQRAATTGFNRWVEAAGSPVSYRVVNDASGANVTVRFDPTKCDGITYTESVGSRIERADINLGVALPGNNSQHMPLLDLACVAAHEFGHTLGLNGHSSDPSDVMYFQHTVGQPWTLTPRDINTLRMNYAHLFSAETAPIRHQPGL